MNGTSIVDNIKNKISMPPDLFEMTKSVKPTIISLFQIFQKRAIRASIKSSEINDINCPIFSFI